MKTIQKLIFLLLVMLSGFVYGSGMIAAREDSATDREQQQLQWCFQYSNLLGYNIEYINNPRLFQLVAEWMGVPYKYSGNSRKGIDCSALVCRLYRDGYNKVMLGSAHDIFKKVTPLKKTDLSEGDLVFFKIRSKRISHVGVYLGQNKFVHASLKRGVVVSNLNDPYYSKYFFKGGRLDLETADN